MNQSTTQNPLRILCLEDNPRDSELIRETLKAEGLHFEILCVRTRDDFLKALESARPDLILSDFSIPAFDGLAALTAAKNLSPETPFVFVSGTIGEERAVESLKSGATDYVLKTHFARLGPAVTRALRESTERQTRKAAELSLKESESRFRQVAENIDEVFWLTSTADNKLLYISPAYEKIWGRPAQPLYADFQLWWEAVHQDERDRLRQLAKDRQDQGYDETYRILRGDGSVRWLRERTFPIRNAAGAVERVVGTAQDVTEQRSLQEQLRQSQKMEGIGQLAGGVAHDFNNLLAIIRGSAELLLMKSDKFTGPEADYLKQIAAAAERAGNLTRQLLAFSRKQAIQANPVNLNDVVANLSRMLQRLIQANIQLRCEYAPHVPPVLADTGMFEQVIVNLVVNARDAMPQGGKLTIRTALATFGAQDESQRAEARPGNFVHLSVNDSGTGIPPENLPRIFEPFFTTKPAGKGTGLGLSTVYGIVKQHRGWIEVSSRPEVGTTFDLYFPAMEPGAAKAPTTEAARQVRGGTETILLVEDEAPVRLITKRVLETFGYKALESSSASEALTLWNQHKDEISLLLTDLVMPDGPTGRELAERLRADKPGLKVILMSGYSPDIAGKDTQFFTRTKTCFLQKPCSTRNLLEALRRCLDD